MGPFQLPSQADYVGDWLRYDGVYRLTVNLNAAGELSVEYLNPESIHIEYTNLAEADKGYALTVMLLDTGYPGSTYELLYLPRHDVLLGTYTIPGQEPTEVYFKRQ
jgi:hypothetical protein